MRHCLERLIWFMKTKMLDKFPHDKEMTYISIIYIRWNINLHIDGVYCSCAKSIDTIQMTKSNVLRQKIVNFREISHFNLSRTNQGRRYENDRRREENKKQKSKIDNKKRAYVNCRFYAHNIFVRSERTNKKKWNHRCL